MSEAADGTTIRVATFNASLNRGVEGQLVGDLSTPNNAQARTVAEIIQRVSPDVLLINEFDYLQSNPMQAVELFRQNYLEVAQNTLGLSDAAAPIDFAYAYIAPSNTGVASGFDLNNNGQAVTTPGAPGYGDDALGFGSFPGQFGMLILSKYEIVSDEIRTFQEFLWKDMPGARLPNGPASAAPADWYSPEELAVFRLSSKSHWDVPILVDGKLVHILASHPTPPVFDGPEDRNGLRNADEIRLTADYVTPGRGSYIYDDDGQYGGLAAGSRFVILGDQNSDPRDGDSLRDAAGNPIAAQQLLNNPLVDTSLTPSGPGGTQQAALQGGANATHLSDPRFDTADFADGAPGNLRADYVLPSTTGLELVDAGVFWPLNTDPLFPLVGTFSPALPGGFPSSDHRLVWVDVAVTEEPTLGFLLRGADGKRLVDHVYRDGALGDTQRGSADDDSTGDALARFFSSYGDVALSRLEFAGGGSLTGAPALAIDWTGAAAAVTGSGALAGATLVVTEFTGSTLDLTGFAGAVVRIGTAEGAAVVVGAATTVVGSAGDDSLTVASGFAGGHRLRGGGGEDSITGGDGADTIEGGAGADAVAGGDGADLFILRKGDVEGDVILDFAAAEGDRIRFRDFLGELTIEIDGDTGIWTITDTDGSRENFQVLYA